MELKFTLSEDNTNYNIDIEKNSDKSKYRLILLKQFEKNFGLISSPDSPTLFGLDGYIAFPDDLYFSPNNDIKEKIQVLFLKSRNSEIVEVVVGSLVTQDENNNIKGIKGTICTLAPNIHLLMQAEKNIYSCIPESIINLNCFMTSNNEIIDLYNNDNFSKYKVFLPICLKKN